ncbi:MATE family efflux transporter [Pontixanthobacter aestiaquae]|uniref:Multidrug-efflux transporter n=1 Tax=Pontixanthobacter aestiaquae TaxID=1509367 RepID=A0A844Z666_9SPHN|nr:MATE family efflux transporter [Pontixanthobacter aestiaquae]MDN3646206.1 MATE family efflux transporter [Pontixanthobacter aestiaquae]MXO82802.1 MATE family efflux transporter [Pontixanthobacter aestiaquae]
MSDGAKLTRGDIRGHLVTQTTPMIIGVAAMMSVGLIDAYFIGQLGSAELAAIALIFPISIALSSLGIGVMVGINSVVSRSLGAGDNENAASRGNIGIAFALMVGIVMAAILLALLDPLFTLMQADDKLMPIIRAYMIPFAMGFPLIMVMMGINGVMRGQGEARKTSYVSICYAVANWILDPILITGALGFEGFGIAGAAYATNIGWAIALVLALFLLKGTALPFNPSAIKRDQIAPAIKALSSVAGPAGFSNAINPIGLSVLTALVATQGQDAVAGFGAAGRIQSFAIVPLLALSGAIGSIVGQNWGANQFDRARQAMRWAAGFSVVYGLFVAVVLVAASGWFAQLFSDNPAVIDEFSRYLAIAAWGYAGFGLLIVSNGALNSVGKAGWALAQSCFRVFLVMMPVAWLLRPTWGSDAIYSAELAANVVGGAVALVLVLRILGQRHSSDKA